MELLEAFGITFCYVVFIYFLTKIEKREDLKNFIQQAEQENTSEEESEDGDYTCIKTEILHLGDDDGNTFSQYMKKDKTTIVRIYKDDKLYDSICI